MILNREGDWYNCIAYPCPIKFSIRTSAPIAAGFGETITQILMEFQTSCGVVMIVVDYGKDQITVYWNDWKYSISEARELKIPAIPSDLEISKEYFEKKIHFWRVYM